jgi:hypothetical protein
LDVKEGITWFVDIVVWYEKGRRRFGNYCFASTGERVGKTLDVSQRDVLTGYTIALS